MANSFKVGLPTKSVPTASKEKQSRFFKVSQDFTSWSKSASTDRYFRIFFFTWSIPLLLIALFTVVSFGGLPRQTPLFYSRVWGETQLAQKGLIFLPIGGVLLLGIFNLSLAANFHQNEKVLSYFLAGCASLVSVLTAITVFNIIILMR